MGHFYAEIQGNRGPASRMGSKKSGMWAHIRGWRIGAEVVLEHDEEYECDVVRIYKTGGSGANRTRELITEIWEDRT